MLRRRTPMVITDSAPSAEQELTARRRRYAILMAVHLVGFALAGVLYYQAWWLGVGLVVVTGVLPWVAVVAANDAPAPPARAARLSRNDSAARELDDPRHRVVDAESTDTPGAGTGRAPDR